MVTMYYVLAENEPISARFSLETARREFFSGCNIVS